MADISELQVLSLNQGGRDGGIVVAASVATEDEIIDKIECLEASTTFTVLAGQDQDGTARDLIADNGYSGIALPIGTVIWAPFGGFIEDFTADQIVRYSRMAASGRDKNDG